MDGVGDEVGRSLAFDGDGEELDVVLTETFARERELFGFVLNPTKVQAHTPGIMKAAKQLSMAVDRSGLLPKELLALVNVRVALINGCPF